MLLDQLPQPRLAKAVVRLVHRLGDAVGEEHGEVARREGDRLLLEQALEHLAVVELQAEHEAVRREHAARSRRVDAGPGTNISGVCPARA